MADAEECILALTEELNKLHEGFSLQAKRVDNLVYDTANQSVSHSEKARLPPKYDGSTYFSTYLVQFEVLAKEQHWSLQKQGVMLLSRLKGRALDLAAQGEDLTYP